MGGGSRSGPKPTGAGSSQKRKERRAARFTGLPVAKGGIAKPKPTEEKQKKPKKTFKKESKADGGFAATAAPKKLYDKDGPKAKPSFDKGKAKPKETAKAPKAPKEKPNAATIQALSEQWEKYRPQSVSEEERKKALSDMAKKVKGKVVELGTNHKTSRLIQAILKQGTTAEKDLIWKEVSNSETILYLSKSSYGNFIVRALLDVTPKNELGKLFGYFKGNVVSLARHPTGSAVLEAAYVLGNATQRSAMVAEFYGPEFSLKAHAAVVQGGTGLKLQDALADPELGGRKAVISHASRVLAGIWEKGMVAHTFIHRVLNEYLAEAPTSMVLDAVEALAGDPALVRMMHTMDGVSAVTRLVMTATAKHRKKMVKGLKGLVAKVANDDYGRMVICCLMETVDDTVLMKKAIISELNSDLWAVACNKSARLCLLHLLSPRRPAYMPTHLLHCLPALDADGLPLPITLVGEMAKAAKGKKRARDADDDDEGERDEGKDQDGDDPDTLQGEEQEQEVVGGVKKPFEVKRRELLSGKGGLGEAMLKMCTEHAGEMVRDRALSDVLAEVVAGGSGGVLAECGVPPEAFAKLYDAIAATAAVGDSGGDDGGMATAEEGAAGEGGEVLEHFVGSRTLRRLVLTAPPPGVDTAFGASLWTAALDGRCARWVGTHAEKVLAALVDCPHVATAKAAAKQLTPLVKPLSVEQWLAKFKPPQQGAKAGAAKGKGNGKEGGHPAAAAKTPAKTAAKTAAKIPAKTAASTPANAQEAATPSAAKSSGPSPATKAAGQRPSRKAARKA